MGSIFSLYSDLQCANSVQMLVRLQQAILQPCASYGCGVWAPADAATGRLLELQTLQHSYLLRACRVKSSIPIEVIFQELSVTGSMISGDVGSLVSQLQWIKLIRQRSALLLCMMPLLSLSMGAPLAQVFRCFASTANPARWWPVLLLRYDLMSYHWLFKCSSRPSVRLCFWTLGLALVQA